MLVAFAANAVVKDEGKTRSGVPELRKWIEEVTEKYHPRLEVEDVVTEPLTRPSGPAQSIAGATVGFDGAGATCPAVDGASCTLESKRATVGGLDARSNH